MLTRQIPQVRSHSEIIKVLKDQFPSQVILRGEGEYDVARQVKNGIVDRYPAAIFHATDANDVSRAILFAGENGIPLAVRSGGHSFAGYSVADGALVLDLSKMKGISIDPTTRTARVQPGVTSGDLGPLAQEHGLALSTGDVSSVGLGGLTTGGGIGWLVRKYGLTIDHLVSAQVVTADGEVLTASETEHPDLFWAIRGGGGNFGVVTKFEYRLQPAGTVLAGALFLPPTKEVLRGHADIGLAAPDGLTTIAALMPTPPAPFVPEEYHGKLSYAILFCYVGDLEEGHQAIAPLRALGTPIAEVVAPMPYPAIYDFTAEGTERAPFAVRSMFLEEYPDDMIDLVLEQANQPSAPLMFQLRPLGGAVARVPQNATAFSHRNKSYMFSVIDVWEDPAETAERREKTEQAWQKLKQFGSGVYVNFLEDEGNKRVRQAYTASNYARLAVLKRRYDPTNFFRLNQNIQPQG